MWTTRLLACVCILAIAGCHGGGRAAAVRIGGQQVSPGAAFPAWVKIPDWAYNARAGVRPTADGKVPSVTLCVEALTWERGAPGDPHMPTQGYAILVDRKRDDIWTRIGEHHPAIGHQADETLVLSQDTWSRTDWMGFVLFAKLLSTSETGAVVQYSIQLVPNSEASPDDASRRMDGTMTLGLETWWSRCLETGPIDGPWNGPRSLVMLKLAGLYWPDEPDPRQAARR